MTQKCKFSVTAFQARPIARSRDVGYHHLASKNNDLLNAPILLESMWTGLHVRAGAKAVLHAIEKALKDFVSAVMQAACVALRALMLIQDPPSSGTDGSSIQAIFDLIHPFQRLW